MLLLSRRHKHISAPLFALNRPLALKSVCFPCCFWHLAFPIDLGSAYGTAKAGVGIASMGVFKPRAVMKNIIPVIMAGILGIYGLIVAVIVGGKAEGLPPTCDDTNCYNQYTAYSAYAHLAAGLACGLSGLASGMAIGIAGDAGVRAVGQQPALFVPNILIMIFAEALGLYGLIVALLVSGYEPTTAVATICTSS